MLVLSGSNGRQQGAKTADSMISRISAMKNNVT